MSHFIINDFKKCLEIREKGRTRKREENPISSSK